MTCSSAPLDEQSWREFEARYGIPLVVCYGTSEAGSVCGNRPYRRKIGTVGLPSKFQQFEIVDDEGKPCPPGVEGEVTCGGPQLCRGIIEPDGSLAPLAGTRYRTGDIAVRDEEGFVRITGRIKDLIIRGGLNIAPLEIDQVLMQHPQVFEAAALGVPDPIYGEEVVAYVVPRDGTSPTSSQLLEHCRARLGAFKAPKRILVVSDIPKSGRGKIMRDALRARWQRDRGAVAAG
jgi:acyl-coenzyme A synthetase/AMP-(fatty) acid ligase